MVQSPCTGLRYQQWYRISPGVRQYAYQLIARDKVKSTIQTIVNYFVAMSDELGQVVSADNQKKMNASKGCGSQ